MIECSEVLYIHTYMPAYIHTWIHTHRCIFLWWYQRLRAKQLDHGHTISCRGDATSQFLSSLVRAFFPSDHETSFLTHSKRALLPLLIREMVVPLELIHLCSTSPPLHTPGLTGWSRGRSRKKESKQSPWWGTHSSQCRPACSPLIVRDQLRWTFVTVSSSCLPS